LTSGPDRVSRNNAGESFPGRLSQMTKKRAALPGINENHVESRERSRTIQKRKEENRK
jgi:hypothetical protein